MQSFRLPTVSVPGPKGAPRDMGPLEFGGKEALAICGPEGSGKSLLLGLLSGTLRPRHGTARLSTGASGSSFFLPSPPSWACNTIAMEVELVRRAWRDRTPYTTPEAPVEQLLADWKIPSRPSDDPASLSSGFAIRLGLLLAGESGASCIFLDGIFSHLDLAGTRLALNLLDRFRSEGRFVCIADNHLERYLARMDRMVLMKEGRIIMDALPERILPYLESHGMQKPSCKLKEMDWGEPRS